MVVTVAAHGIGDDARTRRLAVGIPRRTRMIVSLRLRRGVNSTAYSSNWSGDVRIAAEIRDPSRSAA